MIKPLLNVLVLMGLFVCGFAQQKKYVFTRISTKEGLASNHVHSILQDKKGFMWFGTANGLQRYDGRKIIMFRTAEPEGEYLPARAISQIFLDKKGNFWVRCGKEVGIFDPATFRYKRAKIKLDSEPPVRSDYVMWQDSIGNVFVIIKNHGFVTYDSVTHEFSRSKNPFSLPAGWKPTAILQDPRTRNYWISSDSGFVVYDVRKKRIYNRNNNPENLPLLDNPLLSTNITAFYIDRSYRAWIVSWPNLKFGESFYCYDLNTGELLPDTQGLSGATSRYHELRAFFEQSNNKLWAHGRMLLLERDSIKRRFNYIRDEHLDEFGIKYDILMSMYEDREQNLWLGTDQGVYVFNPASQHFNTLKLITATEKEENEDKFVTSFVETSNKEIWVGSWGKGVYAYDSNFLRARRLVFNGPAETDQNYRLVWALWQHRASKKILVGCQASRIIVHDPATKQNRFISPEILENKTVRQFTEDKDGNIWIGSQYGHIVRWNLSNDVLGTKDEFQLVHNLNTIVYKLFVDDEGFIWACTHAYGVYKIHPQTGRIVARYHNKAVTGKALHNDVATDIVQYDDSLFVIATGALNVLNTRTGNIRHITYNQGLSSHTVNSLALDSQGTLWLGTLNGLSRNNFKKNIITTFSQRDGVMNGDFQPGASYKTSTGTMLFGNARDFVYFKPEAIRPSSAPPDVSITDFKLFNSYLPPDSIIAIDKVRLDHTQNSITIEFAALSFLQKDKIIYYYKMQGLDDEWIRAENMLAANYTLLPPGNYTFKVYCENGEGISSKNITALNIFIRPPFYKTWWFLILMMFVAAGLIYLAHRMKVNRLLAMEKVRTRIARDLHDDMGSTLSTINILSEMAKMKVHSDQEKTGEYLNKISDNSSRMMEAMDDIVWSINPMNDNMVRITARMREFATGVLEAKDIDFTFRVDEEIKDLKLDMESRRDFFLLFKEAVNNLAKYSQCRHAAIDISIQGSKLVMKIQDDGVGFDVASADSGNGLTNMRKRAQTLGGTLDISSEIDKGTHVTLEVPLS